ncbi:G/T mismatch-specific thymine DNA glycosylase [Harpegnathos saltator]|uniref:G/T mismatch-specific thymine DNA glycosylase n=2 Tax=Harpegnathos saltator TaxID=610380 RepID=E2BZR3_HARSA|nr:G/T mismatch-specific thymine DNA glycosylase [Harpegnathos saltator]
MPLDLNKLKKRTSVLERPKKKIDRFDGLSEEEIRKKYTLEDYLEMNLDVIFVGINPSLMAAHRGRYYAGPGNHFYKLLHESGLTPRFVSFEEDYKLLQYGIGLTNIVTRATRSAADLKRTEIKEGAKVVEEKLRLYKPKVAVFNGKCIYEVFANISSKSIFHFGLQPERIGDTAIWVTPSSSARCAHFPRMVDKLHFYMALKKYLHFLKGEITNVDPKEFYFEGKCKQSVPSTSKMWRRKNISTFLHGGRVVNKNTLCQNTSEEDIAAIHTMEFLVEMSNEKDGSEDKDASLNKDICAQENVNKAFKEAVENEGIKKFEGVCEVNNGAVTAAESENKVTDNNRKENCNAVVNNTSDKKTKIANSKNNNKCTSSKMASRTLKTQSSFISNNNRDNSLDFMSIIKQKLLEKNNSDASTIAKLKST